MHRTFMQTALIAMGCVLSIASSAMAVPLNSVTIAGNLCSTAATVSTSSTDGVVESVSSGQGNCALSYTARAGGGGVGIQGSLTKIPGPGSGIVTARAFADTVVEILISTPAGYTGGDIPVFFKAHLAGAASASIMTESIFGRSARGSIEATARLSGFGSSGFTSSSATARARGGASNSLTIGGELLPGLLNLPTIFIDPTIPVEVRFSLAAVLSHAAFNDTTATATVDAFNSLSFALVGPALILPDGFSANSVSGMIVDNVFVGARVSAVPLPASGPLFIAALAGLGLLSRRRKSRES